MFTVKDHSPNLITEWHPTKNGTNTPFNTSYGSDYEAYWICSNCGYEWRRRVANRTSKKSGCPLCKKRWNHSFPELALLFYVKRVFPDTRLDEDLSIKPFKSVDLFIPSLGLAIEYDGLHPHRNRRDKDEEKSKRVLEKNLSLLRIREEGLPEFTFSHSNLKIYSYKRTGEPSVNEYIKAVLLFLGADKLIIDEVDVLKDTIPILRQLSPVKVNNSLQDLFPELEGEWHFERNAPFTPEHFKAKSGYQVWWKCKKNGHDFDAKIISRTKGHGCRFCTGNEVTVESSLAYLFPSIALEWDYERNGELIPERISAHSNEAVFWNCPDCHSSYDNMVNERTGRGENCPYCAGKRVNDTNSLAVLRPNLANEWHPTENKKQPSEIPLGSHYLATWICERGHTYTSYVYSRVAGRGCKRCYEEFGRFQPHKVPFEKSIAKKKPYLLKLWDYEMNEFSPEETGAYARELVWWKCANGCSWQQSPNARNSSRCKCCRVKF